MMSCGAMILPSDLDILRPFSSTTKPCVNKPLYGARSLMAIDVNNEDWNQPRCWSEPSRYKSAGSVSSSRSRSTAKCVVPESNQTSKVSRTALYCSASAPMNSDASRLYQPSMPSCSINFATISISSGVRGCNSLVSLCTKNGIGTPHVR